MLTLIVLLVLGLVLGIFAIQNNSSVTLHYGGYVMSGIPLYMVVIGSMLIGVAISWILSLFGMASTAMQLSGKNRTIRQYSDRTNALEEKMHNLEIENERLKGDTHEEVQVVREDTVAHDRPLDRFLNRLRNSFS